MLIIVYQAMIYSDEQRLIKQSNHQSQIEAHLAIQVFFDEYLKTKNGIKPHHGDIYKIRRIEDRYSRELVEDVWFYQHQPSYTS